jgi:peptidoglycan/xylan/chitin deacetylase (PgdA/CDA1 family)
MFPRPGPSLVLCYHALSDEWPAPLAMRPADFERQLALLVSRGYRGVTFREAVAGGARGKTFVLTFDDAWHSVLERAQPLLARLGIPATVFVPTDFPDRDGPMSWPGVDQWLEGPHRAEMRCLSWDELRGLAAEGWEIGSHTCSHPHLTRLDDAALEHELRASREACSERIGTPCESLAYPYGDVDARVVAAARAAGYTAAGALESKLTPGDPLRWPRVGVYRADTDARFRLKVSAPMLWLRASPAWDALAAGRRLARRG